MRMYHGTVDTYVPAIKREGLRPVAKHAWRVALDNGDEIREIEKVNSVFVTESKNHAIQYAETRVRYFATAPGGTFAMFGAPDFFLTKDLGTEVVQVKPVLIVLDLDDNDHLAMRFCGSIPSSKIVEVVPLALDIPEFTDDERGGIDPTEVLEFLLNQLR